MKYNNKSKEDAEWYAVSEYGSDFKMSPNFELWEFQCSDGSDDVLIHPALINILQQIRDHFGVAITINSAYRTPEYNKKIGGASRSRHVWGMAADIVVDGALPSEVAKYAESINVGGLGRYNTFTHIDVQGENRRWDNR